MSQPTPVEQTPATVESVAPVKVYVVVIEHRHGANTYAAATEAIATRLVHEYVLDNWEAEVLGADTFEVDDLPPGYDPAFDAEDAISRYFAAVDDEFHSIIETDLVIA